MALPCKYRGVSQFLSPACHRLSEFGYTVDETAPTTFIRVALVWTFFLPHFSPHTFCDRDVICRCSKISIASRCRHVQTTLSPYKASCPLKVPLHSFWLSSMVEILFTTSDDRYIHYRWIKHAAWKFPGSSMNATSYILMPTLPLLAFNNFFVILYLEISAQRVPRIL